MDGGAGADVYVVDSSRDIANDSGAELGDMVLATVSVDLATGPFAGIEHVTLLGKAAIDVTGNAAGNRLTGNPAPTSWMAAPASIAGGHRGRRHVNGGTGNDSYIIDAFDSVNEVGGDASDRVRGAFAIDLAEREVRGHRARRRSPAPRRWRYRATAATTC